MVFEIGDGRGRPLQLISMVFFEHFWMTNSHVFLRELIFMIERASSQQFSFRNYFC